jgi:amino acid permease
MSQNQYRLGFANLFIQKGKGKIGHSVINRKYQSILKKQNKQVKMKKNLSFWEAFATIVGTVVGLGIFAIPYAAKNVGVAPTVALIIFIAVMSVLVSILYAEIVIFDKREECIVSYAKRYLGQWMGRIETCSVFFGYTGSILAYVLAISVFVKEFIPQGENYFWPIILFYTAISGLVLLRGIRSLGNLEIVLAGIMCAAFFLVFWKSLPHWRPVITDWSEVTIPYGVVWFSLTGGSAIPITVSLLKRKGKKVFNAIFFAYTLITLVTILFFVAALKTGGQRIGLDPFVAMGERMGSWVFYLGTLIGILAVTTSHWTLATYFNKVLKEDLKINPTASWLLVIFLPVILILLGVSNFVNVIGLVGLVAGTFDALLLIAIYRKIFSRKNTVPRVLPFKMPGYVIWAVFLLLIGAALSSILI